MSITGNSEFQVEVINEMKKLMFHVSTRIQEKSTWRMNLFPDNYEMKREKYSIIKVIYHKINERYYYKKCPLSMIGAYNLPGEIYLTPRYRYFYHDSQRVKRFQLPAYKSVDKNSVKAFAASSNKEEEEESPEETRTKRDEK